MFRFIWRHKRAVAAGSLVGFGAYGAYHLWRKKRDLDELLQSVGLDELLLGLEAFKVPNLCPVPFRFTRTQLVHISYTNHEMLPQL